LAAVQGSLPTGPGVQAQTPAMQTFFGYVALQSELLVQVCWQTAMVCVPSGTGTSR
jgi:hypothetical protein